MSIRGTARQRPPAIDTTLATRKRPNMRDVAAAAGVSIYTVSNVLNKPERVSDAARERVLRAIDELGFIVNSAAQSMKRGGTATSFGIATLDLTHSFTLGVVRGAQSVAHQASKVLLIGNGDTDVASMATYVKFFDEARVEGIILTSIYDSRHQIDELRSHGTHVVAVNYQSTPADHCMVLMDNDEVGYESARHLVSRGCSRLLWVTESTNPQVLSSRQNGVRRAVAASPGVALEEIVADGFNYEGGREIGRLLRERSHNLPDGIISGTGVVARAIIDEFHENSDIRIPRDVKIISTDGDAETNSSAHLALSAMVPPAFEMGAEAFRLLLAESIENPETHEHRQVVLHATLRDEESTARTGVEG